MHIVSGRYSRGICVHKRDSSGESQTFDGCDGAHALVRQLTVRARNEKSHVIDNREMASETSATSAQRQACDATQRSNTFFSFHLCVLGRRLLIVSQLAAKVHFCITL